MSTTHLCIDILLGGAGGVLGYLFACVTDHRRRTRLNGHISELYRRTEALQNLHILAAQVIDGLLNKIHSLETRANSAVKESAK